MPENEVLCTADVATLLGCNEALIRTKKSRNSSRFVEAQHFVKAENNRTLWTMAGVEVLRELISGDTGSVSEDDTTGVTPPDTNGMTNIDTGSVSGNDMPQATTSDTAGQTITDLILNGLVEDTAQSMAVEFYRRLPAAVMRHVQRMNQSPTAHERETVKQQLKRTDVSTVSLALTGLPGM